MASNPYTNVWNDRIVPGPIQSVPQENASYAVGASGWDKDTTSGGDAPYNDNFGWSVTHRLGVDERASVDAMRIGQYPVRSQIPDSASNPDPYWARLDADEKQRESDVYLDADGIEENKGRLLRAPDPRWNPPAPSRRTDSLSPSTWRFFRPFDQLNRAYVDTTVGSARRFNGSHFSMADHRRTYDVTGFAPVRGHRNTYRYDPAPWDSNVVDLPPIVDNPSARFRDTNIPGNPRSNRLG